MSFQRIAFQLRNSLWFIPALWVMGAGCLAILATWIDSVTPAIGRDLPLVFGGGPDGARSVLSSIAGSTITVAGVTFSITIVALQLASSQFSPRVLRDFMRDRLSQSVLGSFIGTFFYSLVVLRSIRSADETGPEFVPAVAVTLGIAFAVLAVAMLVYFIHHISTRIQVSSIVAGIAHATERAIERAMEDDGSYQRVPEGERQHGLSHAERPDGEPGRLPAATSGYLQLIDRRGIVATADELDLVVRLELRPGDWVQEGAPLFVVWPAGAADDELADRLHERVTIGAERSLEQDPAFGLRQLVDVAVKALSPGINDPTTARTRWPAPLRCRVSGADAPRRAGADVRGARRARVRRAASLRCIHAGGRDRTGIVTLHAARHRAALVPSAGDRAARATARGGRRDPAGRRTSAGAGAHHSRGRMTDRYHRRRCRA
jgi:uncharacterized membrane protein